MVSSFECIQINLKQQIEKKNNAYLDRFYRNGVESERGSSQRK